MEEESLNKVLAEEGIALTTQDSAVVPPPVYAPPQIDYMALAAELDRDRISVSSLGQEIASDVAYQRAGEIRLRLASALARRTSLLEGLIGALHTAHRFWTAQRAALQAPYTKMLASVDALMDGYNLRKQEQAEKARRELAEAQARTQQDAAEKARRLREQGDMKKAAAIESAAATMIQPVVIDGSLPKIPGLRTTEVWTASCGDPMALLKAVADGTIPLVHIVRSRGKDTPEPLFVVNERVLKYYAAEQKEEFNGKWPGCWAEKTDRRGRTGR